MNPEDATSDEINLLKRRLDERQQKVPHVPFEMEMQELHRN